MRLEPPTKFYENIGRVVVAASGLEAAIASVAYVASGIEPGEPGDSWGATAQPGGAVRALREAIGRVRGDALRGELHRLADDAHALLDQRNTLVHSVLILEMGAEPGAAASWLGFHPKSGTERPVPSDAEAAGELVRRLQALMARAVMLSGRVADSLRTEDGGGAR